MGLVKYRVTLRRGYGEVEMEAESVDELLKNLSSFKKLTEHVDSALGPETPTAPTTTPTMTKTRLRRGKSEAVVALENIEAHLLPDKFFNQPRSTAEVRQKLKELTGITFQSRKVSQALGILYQTNKLSRTGTRGNYRYFKKP